MEGKQAARSKQLDALRDTKKIHPPSKINVIKK